MVRVLLLDLGKRGMFLGLGDLHVEFTDCIAALYLLSQVAELRIHRGVLAGLTGDREFQALGRAQLAGRHEQIEVPPVYWISWASGGLEDLGRFDVALGAAGFA